MDASTVPVTRRRAGYSGARASPARSQPDATGRPRSRTNALKLRTRRHHDPQSRARDDHRSTLSKETISAIRPAPISPSRRTVTPRASIEPEPRSGSGAASTSSVAKAGSRSGSFATAIGSASGPVEDVRASLPLRAKPRHADNCPARDFVPTRDFAYAFPSPQARAHHPRLLFVAPAPARPAQRRHARLSAPARPRSPPEPRAPSCIG